MSNIFEMTKKEYLQMVYDSLTEHKKEIWLDQIEKPEGWIKTRIQVEIAKHKVAIIDAIWTGINVSNEVLKDYPDIIEKFKNEIEENKLLKAI